MKNIQKGWDPGEEVITFSQMDATLNIFLHQTVSWAKNQPMGKRGEHEKITNRNSMGGGCFQPNGAACQ
jgi:hypothetical protein